MKKRVCLLLALMVWAGCAVAKESPRESESEPVIGIHHDVSPGTLDVGSGSHRDYYLREKGTYSLKGSTTSNTVHIAPSANESIIVILENGLSVTETGSTLAAPAMEICDSDGGIVTLRVASGAGVYLEGSNSMPAILKNGTGTKLVIEAADPQNPGKLTLLAGREAPALGSVDSASGNICFKSGNVVATAYNYDSTPGIGTANGHDFTGVTFDGATINATGNPGIGCGRTTSRITSYKTGKFEVVISGGIISAQSLGNDSPGIGCMTGIGGEAKITVHEGEIIATGHGEAPAIGGMAGTKTTITINGGYIKTSVEKDNIPAIGNNNRRLDSLCRYEVQPTEIFINGGRINTLAFSIGYGGIGAHTDQTYTTPQDKVKIEGGTIETQFLSAEQKIINGGCVFSASSVTNAKRKQGNKETPVMQTFILLDEGPDLSELVRYLNFNDAGFNYGQKDVYPLYANDYPSLYLYLPQGYIINRADFSDASYRGSVSSGSLGLLFKVHKVTIDGNGNGQDPVITHIAFGEKYPDSFSNPIRLGYKLLGFNAFFDRFSPPAQRIFGLTNDSGHNAYCRKYTKYTDSNGQWIKKSDNITLFAEWEEARITLHFKGKEPSGSTYTVEGSTADKIGYTGGTIEMPECGFTLKGYDFKGWLLPSRITPKTYLPGDIYTVQPSTESELTLNAIWTGKPYTVRFVSDTSSTVYEQNMTFDRMDDLDANRFTAPQNYVFYGWQKQNDPEGTIYHDKDAVKNLCDINAARNTCDGWTLKALWMEKGDVRIAVTLDDDPLTNLQCSLSGINNETVIPLKYNRTYRCYVPRDDSLSVPFGTYMLIIGNDSRLDTSYRAVSVDADHTGIEHFDYYTVLFQNGDHCVTTVEDHPTGTSFITWAGDQLTVRTTVVDTGYTFSHYQFEGSIPDMVEYGGAKIMLIRGTTTATSVARANIYTLRFHANGGDGTMDDLRCEYDRTYNLPDLSFTRKNHRFACWTTTPQWTGTGTSWQNRASIRNLTADDEAVIELYAQWSPEGYYIVFHDTGFQNSPANITQKCFFDTPTRLLDTGFTWEEHTLLGWNTKEDGSGTSFAVNQTVTNLVDTPESVIHLYTQWGGPAYAILSQSSDLWIHDSTATLSFTTDGPATTVAEVLLDGSPVSMLDYSISGSPLCITLSADFLDTLPIGRHSIALKFVYCKTPPIHFNVAPPVYRITQGANSHWLYTSSDPHVFKSDGPLIKFRQLYIDGRLMDESLYRTTEGSTIVTLPASTMRSLGVGSHTIKFKYAWCETDTAVFTVDSKAVPVTGDPFPLLPLLGLLAAGIILPVILLRGKRKARE